VAPVAVGSVLGWKLGGVFSVWLFVCTLLSAMALQVATNFFNDALDFQKGADTEARLGPRRITAAGASSVRMTLMAGGLLLLVAIAFGVPLIAERGWPILLIGVPSLYFCYGYTGGPVPLAYRGLGEGFVILFFGLVAVSGCVFVLSGLWRWEGVVAGLQVGCLSTVLIAINNLRDREEDLGTGKRTLAVRFGLRFARWEILLLHLLAYLMGMYWMMKGVALVFWLSLLLLPLSFAVVRAVFVLRPSAAFNRWLALSGVQLLVFALLMCLGFYWGGGVG